MQKKTILAFMATVIVMTGIWYGSKIYSEYRYNRETVIAGHETGSITVLIEPDDTATRAAANYFAYSAEQALGREAVIVTESDEPFRGIRILCGTEFLEPEGEKATIEFITPAEAANDSGSETYSILPGKTEVTILVPERADCFGAVKAITDRWLQKDCGLESKGELRISRAMVDRQLTGLDTEVTGQIRILTQNLCYSDDGEGRTVEERAKRFFRLVQKYQPDVIGTQECSWQWLQLLHTALGEHYARYGESREGPSRPEGERDVILFRKDRFELADGETFWLSNTPSEPYTKLNYQGACRICTKVLLRDRETGKTLLFSNTHLEPVGQEFGEALRDQQTEILLRHLRKDANYLFKYPGFLTGDFNGEDYEPFYSRATAIYEDAKTTAITDSSAVDYSFHDYGNTQYLIDYCFHSPKNATVLDYRIVDDQYGDYISDHYGILVTAVLN